MSAGINHHSSLSSPCRAVSMVARRAWKCGLTVKAAALPSSSAVPPSALCPGNIQMACACTMPYDACTNGKCTCPPPCSSCLRTWEATSSMPHPPSAWPCLQCSSCSLSSYHHLVFFFCPCLALDNISELVIELEMSLESIAWSRHGHNLLVTGGFGSPSSLSL